MRIEHHRIKRGKAKELLAGEVPEGVDFDPERDLTSVQIRFLFDRLDRAEESSDWIGYESLFVMMQALWPDMKGRELVCGPQAEVEKKLTDIYRANRVDLWLRAISTRHELGLPVDVFLQPDLVKDFLQQFDLKCKMQAWDVSIPAEALAMIRLRLRPLNEVFPDREEAWKRSQRLLNSFYSADLGLYARLVVELKVSFPEHENEIRMKPEDIRELKQTLLRVSPSATSKVVETAYYLKLVTADRVELGLHGEYVVSSGPLAVSSSLPERDMT